MKVIIITITDMDYALQGMQQNGQVQRVQYGVFDNIVDNDDNDNSVDDLS
jgi:hypothetical protein